MSNWHVCVCVLCVCCVCCVVCVLCVCCVCVVCVLCVLCCVCVCVCVYIKIISVLEVNNYSGNNCSTHTPPHTHTQVDAHIQVLTCTQIKHNPTWWCDKDGGRIYNSHSSKERCIIEPLCLVKVYTSYQEGGIVQCSILR